MKNYLSIEVGEQKVRYILVSQDKKNLTFKGAGESTVQVGPSAPGALANFVQDLVDTRKLKIDRLFLTINRSDTVVHQLNLGQVSKADLELIIPSEIEKIPFFAEKDFDYVHQQYEMKGRNKIIFGAMTDNLLRYLLKEIKQTNIPCQELEMVPLNLAGVMSAQEYKEGAQSIIIVGDRITHLMVIEDQHIRYLYSTTIGEEIFAEPSTAMNWGEELKRALKSYVLETKQVVGRVWLVWDRDKAPDFDKYLSEELNINAKPLEVMREWFNESINPVYTLAAIPLIYYLKNIKPTFPLNHFLRGSQVLQRVKRVAMVAAGLVLVTGIVIGCIISRFMAIENKAIADKNDVQQRITLLQKQSADILNERDSYLALRRQLLFQATYVRLLKNISWSEALSVVADEMPKELSLESFKVDETGAVTFTGEAFRVESIAQLLRTIETSKILDRGQFSYLTEAEIEHKKVLRFGILANVKAGEQYE